MKERKTQQTETWKMWTGDAMILTQINEDHLRLIRGGTIPNQPLEPEPPV